MGATESKGIIMDTELVFEESCPCFMGGSCPTDYEHK